LVFNIFFMLSPWVFVSWNLINLLLVRRQIVSISYMEFHYCLTDWRGVRIWSNCRHPKRRPQMNIQILKCWLTFDHQAQMSLKMNFTILISSFWYCIRFPEIRENFNLKSICFLRQLKRFIASSMIFQI
jgi:hypothetical protein